MTASTARFADWEEIAGLEPTEEATREVFLALVADSPVVTGGGGALPRVDWKRLAALASPEGDPGARVRMAALLESVTGWAIFPELRSDREYVSQLWAEDWDSPEDAVYDDE